MLKIGGLRYRKRLKGELKRSATLRYMNRRTRDSSGDLRSLRHRRPLIHWTALLVSAAMVLAGFSALMAAL